MPDLTRQDVIDMMAGQRLLDECNTLSKEVEGFDTREVLEYMRSANGQVTSPREAWEKMTGSKVPEQAMAAPAQVDEPDNTEDKVRESFDRSNIIESLDKVLFQDADEVEAERKTADKRTNEIISANREGGQEARVNREDFEEKLLEVLDPKSSNAPQEGGSLPNTFLIPGEGK